MMTRLKTRSLTRTKGMMIIRRMTRIKRRKMTAIRTTRRKRCRFHRTRLVARTGSKSSKFKLPH